MTNLSRRKSRNRALVIAGLGIALLIAVFLSPLASKDPDGLNRVSQDLKFDHRAAQEAPAKKLPFYGIFNAYAVRGVPEQVATPLAGLIGTLVTFGLAWGIGKLVIRRSHSSADNSTSNYPDQSSE